MTTGSPNRPAHRSRLVAVVGAVVVAGVALLGSWARPAGASPLPEPVREAVTLTWPAELDRLYLAGGATSFELTLRSSAGDAPIGVSDLTLSAPGLPARVYVEPTSVVLVPGRPTSVRVTVAATSRAAGRALPESGRLVVGAVLHTRTVVAGLSDNVLFANGAWTIAPGAERALRTLLGEVQRFAGQVTRLQVTGYADSLPDSALSNRTLSYYRARAVASWLEHHGVRAGSVHPVGAGATDFVASNATAAGRERNRRVVVDLTLSRAAQPVLADAQHPVVIVSLPSSPAVRAARPPAHRSRPATAPLGAAAAVAAVVGVGVLSGLVARRQRRHAGALPGRPPRWVHRLPRWDRRRLEVERGARPGS